MNHSDCWEIFPVVAQAEVLTEQVLFRKRKGRHSPTLSQRFPICRAFSYLYVSKQKERMNIKNIVFDFGGVLVDWNPRHLYRNYFKDEKQMEYFLANICTNEWNAEHDRGRSFDEGVRILTEKFPQYAELIRLYRDKWDVMLKGALPESVELLWQLKSEGYKLYGLTNWSAETFPVACARFDFFRWFDGIVVSGEEKLIKPDPAIFELLLSRYGLKAEETVFIDDGPANVETARHLGFNAIHFDDIGNVTRQLREILSPDSNARI